MMTRDTIAAAATPAGVSAIGVVRLSGPDTAAVLGRIFLPARDKWESHRLYYGHIHDEGRLLDEVMAALMRGPRSYTREDVAEIYTHGGMTAVGGVLGAALKNGARPAMPGEFTQRAFLNGRIDLTQAEAVMDIINAKTAAAGRAGLRQLGGGLSDAVNGFRDRILTWLAHIELSIDYPEHEAEAMNLRVISRGCEALIADMQALNNTAKAGRLLREGLSTAIIGRPNVGKSSLLNAILKEERAIVTEIAGTTRDVITEPHQIGGLPLLLADTAGIRRTGEPVEMRGVEKTLEWAGSAELILFVTDRSQPPCKEDDEILELAGGKAVITLLNKCDLPPAAGWEKYKDALEISAKQGTGFDALYARISGLFNAGIYAAAEADIITRERHRYLLEQSMGHLKAAVQAIAGHTPEDLVSIDLRAAYTALNELVGAEVGDDVVERIFSEFCVGK